MRSFLGLVLCLLGRHAWEAHVRVVMPPNELGGHFEIWHRCRRCGAEKGIR